MTLSDMLTFYSDSRKADHFPGKTRDEEHKLAPGNVLAVKQNTASLFFGQRDIHCIPTLLVRDRKRNQMTQGFNVISSRNISGSNFFKT